MTSVETCVATGVETGAANGAERGTIPVQAIAIQAINMMVVTV